MTDVQTSAQGPLVSLGAKHEAERKGYVYFRNVGGAAMAVGDVIWQAKLATYSMYEGTYVDGDADVLLAAGVAVSAVADDGYGWAQVNGYCAQARNDDGVANADPLVGHTVDKEADTMAATEEHLVFGFACGDTVDTGGDDVDYGPAILHNCLWNR